MPWMFQDRDSKYFTNGDPLTSEPLLGLAALHREKAWQHSYPTGNDHPKVKSVQASNGWGGHEKPRSRFHRSNALSSCDPSRALTPLAQHRNSPARLFIQECLHERQHIWWSKAWGVASDGLSAAPRSRSVCSQVNCWTTQCLGIPMCKIKDDNTKLIGFL